MLVDSSRLLVIPNNLQDTVAASFSVPYQTAYSLVRRSGAFTSLKHALITAPTSATSLAIMQILRFHNLPFTILARDQSSISKLNSLGFDRVIVANPYSAEFSSVLSASLSNLQISHVFDNFPDVYAYHLTPYLAFSCRYMFAGLLDQGILFQDKSQSSLLFSQVIHRFMMKNIHFIGNCLGTHQDLVSSLDLLTSPNVRVSIDSLFEFNNIGQFLNSSFLSPLRFGKSVLSLI